MVILTTFDLDEYVYGGLRAGASGFLLKDVTPERLVDAIRVVAGGDALLAPSVTRRLIERFAVPGEDPDGFSRTDPTRPAPAHRSRAGGARPRGPGLDERRDRAARIHVSPATAKTHVGRILGKLGARDRAQLVVLAYETGLVTPGV